ncbi:MAG: hypothetical protein ABUK01_15665 [Leptospirales bacterium]
MKKPILYLLISGVLYGQTTKPFNPQEHIAANVDVYVEIAPLEKINYHVKEFFFQLLGTETAEAQWKFLQQMVVSSTGVNFLDLEEMKKYGFDIKKPIGLGLREPDTNTSKKKEPHFSILFPSNNTDTLYRNILIRSDQKWEEHIAEKEIKTSLDVHEIEKGKIALIDPGEKTYLGKGEGFIVVANNLELLNKSLVKSEKPISNNPGYKKLSANYMAKLREPGAVISIFLNGKFIRSEAEKTDPVNAENPMEKFLTVIKQYRAGSNDAYSVVHLTKNGLRYLSTSSVEPGGKKPSPIQNIIQREPYLSRIDRTKQAPYIYAKFQYNWMAIFNDLEKLDLPVRPEINKFLHKMIGPYAVNNISSDFTTWIHSNISLFISRIPDLSTGKPDKGWQGSISFNFDTDKRKLIKTYLHKLEKEANHTENVSVVFRNGKNLDEWEFIETLEGDGNEKIESDVNKPSKPDVKKTIVSLHSDEFIITFGRKKVLKSVSRPVIKKTGKNIDYKSIQSFLYIDVAAIIESVKKGKSSFTRMPYWMYIKNIKQFHLYEYLHQNYINSLIEIKL